MAGSAKVGAVIAFACRIVVAAVFVYAGGVKVLDPAGFALAIDNYRLLPYPLAAMLAVYLPWAEIVCGASVLWPRVRCGGLAVLSGLCLIFAGAIVSAALRGLDIGCGCFGPEEISGVSPAIALLRDVVLLLLCAWLLRWEMRGPASPRLN